VTSVGFVAIAGLRSLLTGGGATRSASRGAWLHRTLPSRNGGVQQHLSVRSSFLMSLRPAGVIPFIRFGDLPNYPGP
jgi:hypothetical protein